MPHPQSKLDVIIRPVVPLNAILLNINHILGQMVSVTQMTERNIELQKMEFEKMKELLVK